MTVQTITSATIMFVFIQINAFDDNFELERAKKKVRGVVDEIASHANLPHYKIVGNIDGVALKKKIPRCPKQSLFCVPFIPSVDRQTLLTLIQNTFYQHVIPLSWVFITAKGSHLLENCVRRCCASSKNCTQITMAQKLKDEKLHAVYIA